MKSKLNKKDIGLIGITLLAGIIIGGFIFHSPKNESQHDPAEHSEAEETQYTCSMHPQIKQNEPGLCPICAMDLVPLSTNLSNDENADPNEIQMSASALALASIQTTFVKKGIPEKNIQLLGKVKADERNISEITARFGGRIEKLFINYTGQQVQEGEKLGTIYSPELISAQKEFLETMKYKDSNPSFYKAARTKLKLWDLNDSQINAITEKGEPIISFELFSPISGTITKRHVSIGDYIKEGSQLFEIINLSRVWVMFDAYESDLPWIKTGDRIDFTIQSLPGKIISGRVSYIDPFIDAQTRVAEVRVELNNLKHELKPEMFANGILKSAIADNTDEILIPKSAILWTGKRAVVYVKVPGRETASFINREITLGPESGNFYVVREGLSEGEEIAMNGVFKIDAAAQLAGKLSMMNPDGEAGSTPHDMLKMSSVGDVKPINKQELIQKESEPDNLEGMNQDNQPTETAIENATFKVSGNCGMCKSTIEKAALSVEGVGSAEWDKSLKIIRVSLNTDEVQLSEIHKAIANAGYDTEEETASEETYNKLPPCCRYTRNNQEEADHGH